MIKGTFLLIFYTQIVIWNTPGARVKANWDYNVLNTAVSASYLSSFEKEIILEINKVRSDPTKFAKDYITPLANNYKGKYLFYPDDNPLKTQEGAKALHECIRYLTNHTSLPLLYPSKGLTKAAQDHVDDQSRTGQTGHTGSDRSGFRERMERYGKWENRIAENIAYGGTSARQIIIYLLIDDGIKNRGHRKNFLNPEFRRIGVATGSHPSFGTMSVMDLAAGFKTK